MTNPSGTCLPKELERYRICEVLATQRCTKKLIDLVKSQVLKDAIGGSPRSSVWIQWMKPAKLLKLVELAELLELLELQTPRDGDWLTSYSQAHHEYHRAWEVIESVKNTRAQQCIVSISTGHRAWLNWWRDQQAWIAISIIDCVKGASGLTCLLTGALRLPPGIESYQLCEGISFQR